MIVVYIVPTDKSYCIHLYDFDWRDNEKDPGGHLMNYPLSLFHIEDDIFRRRGM